MNEPVIDSVVFNEIAELMGDALGSFIETYLDNSPKLLNAMEVALPEGDLDAIIHNAHQLKGGSGSIGAMQVFQYAKLLEEEAREGKTDTLQSNLVALIEAYKLVDTDLRVYL